MTVQTKPNTFRAGPDERHPFVVRDMKIWEVHYAFRPQVPCLILLDLMMPNMNGWEFCVAQQKDPRLSPIPVVVISARADLDHAVAQIPVAGHLSKPIDIDRLLHIVWRHCNMY